MTQDVRVTCEPTAESPGRLTYQLADYAFDFQPAGIAEPATLLFGSVQVQVDSAGRCRYPWGYSPFHGWDIGRIPLTPTEFSGQCVVDSELEPGDVLVITEPADTATTLDTDAGCVWLRSRSNPEHRYDWACSIAPGVTLTGWEDGTLGGLLLKPLNLTVVLEAIKRSG